MIKRSFLKEGGFSLIELLMVCSIMVFVIMGVSLMLEGGYSTYGKIDDQIAAQNEARRNVFRMAKYIRECTEITQASAADLTIRADIDDDGVPETVRFYLIDSDHDSLYELNQTVDGTVTTELGQYVTATDVLTFYKGNGDQITNMEDAKTISRSIKIKLLVDVDISEAPDALLLESAVKLRNFE